MSQPVVSYVIASFNHEAYIDELLQSIRDQTFPDFEVIVVDDGSQDRTAQIARGFASKDERITLLAQENSGVVKARNRGLAVARGRYISIVDSDDLLPSDRTARQVATLDASPDASLVYGNAWIIDKQGRRIGSVFDHYPPVEGAFSGALFASYCFVPAVSVMFRRSSFARTGPLWGPGACSDYLKWIELGLVGDAICLRNERLGCWRQHDTNVSARAIEGRVRDYRELHGALEEVVRRHPELGEHLGRRALARRYARCHFMAGFYAGVERRWAMARSEFGTALRLYPSALHAGAWVSTSRGIRGVSALLYDVALRNKLSYRDAGPSGRRLPLRQSGGGSS